MRATQVQARAGWARRLDGAGEGWNRLQDGPLLDVMSGEIDALITVDRGLRFQQRIHGRSFAVILLRAKSNRFDRLLPLVPALLQVLSEVKPGEVREITE